MYGSNSNSMAFHKLSLGPVYFTCIWNFVFTSTGHSEVVTDPFFKGLILTSEASDFEISDGIEFKGNEVFISDAEEHAEITTFSSVVNPDFKLMVKSDDAKEDVIVLEGEGILNSNSSVHFCFVRTFVVLRSISQYIDHHTAHIAHIRKVSDEYSVEWDFFLSYNLNFTGQFLSAFTSDNLILDNQGFPEGRTAVQRRLKNRKLLQENGTNVDGNDNIDTSSYKKLKLNDDPVQVRSNLGLGKCPNQNTISPDFSEIRNGSNWTETNVINYVLNILHVHCLPNIFEETKKLFDMNLVGVSPDKDIEIYINMSHPVITTQLLSVSEWKDLISAIYLHTFTQAYLQQLHDQTEHLKLSPNVQTLTYQAINILKLIRSDPLKSHLIKIMTIFIMTLGASREFYIMEMDELEVCADCKEAQTLNKFNRFQLFGIMKFIKCDVVQSFNEDDDISILLHNYLNNPQNYKWKTED